MKKILIIGLALIMCMGMVFAAEQAGYTLQLTTTVEDGSGGGGGGIDDGYDFKFGGIKGWIFYSPDTELSIGDTSENNLIPVTQFDNENEGEAGSSTLAADLDGKTTGADKVYLYIMTTSNCSTDNNNGTVKFESDGWYYDTSNYEGEEQANIALSFNSEAAGEENEYKVSVISSDSGASSPNTTSSAQFTYSAKAGSNSMGEKTLTAKSTVTWPQDTNPLAGEWKADIKIYISSTT